MFSHIKSMPDCVHMNTFVLNMLLSKNRAAKIRRLRWRTSPLLNRVPIFGCGWTRVVLWQWNCYVHTDIVCFNCLW